MTQRPLRFGVINEQMLPPDAWLAQARHIEQLGYDTLLIRDHLVREPFGDQYAPLIALMAAAMATDRLKVGTLVLDNDFHHPAFLAKELATLAVFSGGRLEVGLGAGWLTEEYRQAGIDFDRAGVRIERLAEAIPIIKRLLDGEPVSHAGKHYQLDGLSGVPMPAQRPRLLLGGGKPKMLRLAGREADIVSLLTSSVASGALEARLDEVRPDTVRRKIGWIQEGAGERFPEIELNMIPSLVITDDRERGAQQLAQQRGWDGLPVAEILPLPSVLIGNADEIAAGIQERFSEYGISYWVVSDEDYQAFAPVVSLLRQQSVEVAQTD